MIIALLLLKVKVKVKVNPNPNAVDLTSILGEDSFLVLCSKCNKFDMSQIMMTENRYG